MTKEKRLEQFDRDTEGFAESDFDQRLIELARKAYLRGYDEGFADGCTAGTRHATQVQDFVNEVLFKR